MGQRFGDRVLWRADQGGKLCHGLNRFHRARRVGVAIVGKAVHREIVDPLVVDVPGDPAGLGEDMRPLFRIALMLV